MDSQEYDRWGRAIAEGDWLGREPFFQAPLYPYAIAAIYRFVAATPFAVYLFQIAFDVAGLWALARAGQAMVDRRTGLAAAALGALYVPAWFHDVQLLKEGPALATTGFLLWALASARRGERARGWLGAGAVAGALTLLRENLLAGLPVLAALLGSGRAPGGRRGAPRPSCSARRSSSRRSRCATRRSAAASCRRPGRAGSTSGSATTPRPTAPIARSSPGSRSRASSARPRPGSPSKRRGAG